MVQCLRFILYGFRCYVYDLWCMVYGLVFMILAFKLRCVWTWFGMMVLCFSVLVFYGLGIMVQCSRIQDLWFQHSGYGFRIQGFMAYGLVFQDLGFMVLAFRVWVQDLRFKGRYLLFQGVWFSGLGPMHLWINVLWIMDQDLGFSI